MLQDAAEHAKIVRKRRDLHAILHYVIITVEGYVMTSCRLPSVIADG
jgi:hypothetical protein